MVCPTPLGPNLSRQRYSFDSKNDIGPTKTGLAPRRLVIASVPRSRWRLDKTHEAEADCVIEDREPQNNGELQAFSAHGLHRVIEDILGDRRAKFLAIVCRESEVNACEDASVLHFVQC